MVVPTAFAAALPRSKSVTEWRRLTGANPAHAEAFLHKDDLWIVFSSAGAKVEFSASLGRVRIPAEGYQVNSALLKLRERLVPNLSGRNWREATVIEEREWQQLATNLVERLTPSDPGHGRYYQGLMSDRLLYRDSQGIARSTSMTDAANRLVVEARFSIQETLQILARLMEENLVQAHPGRSLFLILAPHSKRFPEPLLLDVAGRQCIWLSPEGLIDPERGLSLVTSREGWRALLLEGHGLALLKNPFSSGARLADLGLQTVARWLRLPLPRSASPPIKESKGMDLADWERWLNTYTGTRPESGALQLLIDGEQFFPRLQQAIAQATNDIRFETFIFDRDDVAVQMAEQLQSRSAEVHTEVLMDRLGSLAGGLSPPGTPLPEDFVPPASISKFLREDSQVNVHHFLNPWLSSDHSKLYLVDGHAWLGGMNIGREYRYEWHDLMIEVSGPVTGSLRESFRRHWAHEGPWGDLGYAAAFVRQELTRKTEESFGPWIPVRRLPTRTFWKPFNAAVQASLRKAQSYIYLENPYLFDRRVIRALVRARQRGVDVRVILPRVNDFKAGARSNLVTANFLLTHGVRVFFYPGMTHVKALLVDDWACLGSGNLNHLSLRLSQEENIATSDPAFASKLKRDLFEMDFARSYELTEPLAVNWLDFLADLAAENL